MIPEPLRQQVSAVLAALAMLAGAPVGWTHGRPSRADMGSATANNPVRDLPGYMCQQALVPVDGIRKFVRVEATE